MKFSEMPYVRPDPEKIKKWTADYTEKLKNAQSYLKLFSSVRINRLMQENKKNSE